MPAIASPLLFDSINSRSVANSSAGPPPNATNPTVEALQVICAWPVSGQYGPGTRFSYYFLVGACVFLQKTAWLRNACLAAALLFPTVAALHGIVLASLNTHGAVDMDIYGAFQLSAIGILAAPVTVRLSNTYWNEPGRNLIFLWTGRILAGLLSITVEFYRLETKPCPTDDNGHPIPLDRSKFPYSDNPSCGLTCTVDDGPFSPMRRGAANNIYVIPAPYRLPFGTATLISAACCIPAILSLVLMAFRILELHSKRRIGEERQEQAENEIIDGTNGATRKKMRNVDSFVRRFLNALEVPVFSAIVLVILIIGELNFFSRPVSYQVERMAAVGQWSPIATVLFAALGSLYILLAGDVRKVEHNEPLSRPTVNDHNASPRRPEGDVTSPARVSSNSLSGGEGRRSMQETRRGPVRASARSPESTESPDFTSESEKGASLSDASLVEPDKGYRRRVAKTLLKMEDWFGGHTNSIFDSDQEFMQGKAKFPEIPAEDTRNPKLSRIKTSYNQMRDPSGLLTPTLPEARSRATSTSRVDVTTGQDSLRPPRPSLPSSMQIQRAMSQ